MNDQMQDQLRDQLWSVGMKQLDIEACVQAFGEFQHSIHRLNTALQKLFASLPASLEDLEQLLIELELIEVPGSARQQQLARCKADIAAKRRQARQDVISTYRAPQPIFMARRHGQDNRD